MKSLKKILARAAILAALFPFTGSGISPLEAAVQETKSSARLNSLYNSLDPLSIIQNLAFYELYPDTVEGNLALKKAWRLLCGNTPLSSSPLILPKLDLQAIVCLTTRQPSEPPIELTEEQLQIMQRVGSSLANRKLKGSSIWKEEELLNLPIEEIDLGRALLLYQFEKEPEAKKKVLQYEASLDLMALQIKAKTTPETSHEELIKCINSFIFQEMGFRFPPLAVHAKDIDLYTFLPSVLDSRRGVCLGVSILYLCLAQRLDLPLEIITPPGHIYLRYPSKEGMLNIETTARGINLPSETYLGINTRYLQKRNIKETIGTAFINQASVSWGKENYKEAVILYERASLFLPEDPLLKMLLGINQLLLGNKKEGKALLSLINPLTFDYAVSPETIPSDYLNGNVDVEGLKTIFLPVDEHRSSILKKQALIQKTLKKYPKFRAGLLQLATTYLQLGKTGEALDVLLAYHAIDPADATVEYYLSILCLERLDYLNAWKFFANAKDLIKSRNHDPKALKELQAAIRRACPSPS